MRYGLSGASVAVYKGKILVAGGVGAGGILKAVKRLLVYDIDTNEWQVGPPMNFARKCHGSYVFQDCLYVIGGTDSRKPVMSVEKVDLTCLPLAPVKDFRKFEEPLETTWKIMETLPSWHNGTSGVFGFGNAMAAISVYGIDHDKLFTHRSWGNFPSNNQRLSRDHPGLAKFKNGILVVGGSEDREPLDSVESFDFDLEAEGPRWNLWEQKLNIPREGPGVLQVDEETIFVVGGRGDNVDGSVEIWKDSQWTLSPSLKVKHPNQEYHCILLENQF